MAKPFKWDKLHFKAEITLFERKHKVHIVSSEVYAKEIARLGLKEIDADNSSGFNTPEDEIYVLAQHGVVGDNWFYMFDNISQCLWHEIGHSIDRYFPLGSIRGDEQTSVIGEQYFIYYKKINKILKAFHKDIEVKRKTNIALESK